jgi:hypothetical protein
MTETTAAATKANTAKHAASPFGLPDYGIPNFEMPKFDMSNMEMPEAFREMGHRSGQGQLGKGSEESLVRRL